MKQTSFNITRINDFHIRECHNSINSLTYFVILKNIFSLNYVTNKIMKTKLIKSYQYYHKSFFIYIRYRTPFLRFIINNNFLIIINKAFRNNLNNEMYRRICHFKMFNFNNNVYIKFNFFLSFFARNFDNYNIFHNHI